MDTQHKVRLLLRRFKSSGWEAWGVTQEDPTWRCLAASTDLQEVMQSVRRQAKSDYLAPIPKPSTSRIN